MTPEAQRIAIAEWCGFKEFRTDTTFGVPILVGLSPKHGHKIEQAIPDYLNDLNAMHEAEKSLSGPDRERFAAKLFTLVIGSDNNLILGRLYEEDLALVVSATAAHRAEALLRARGKWVETKQEPTR